MMSKTGLSKIHGEEAGEKMVTYISVEEKEITVVFILKQIIQLFDSDYYFTKNIIKYIYELFMFDFYYKMCFFMSR